MYSNLKLRAPGTLDGLSRQEMLALLDVARGLKLAAQSGQPQRLLRGKNIALLCESDTDPAAEAFAKAAAALGAQVARIRPSDSGLLDGAEVRETARMLGLLYNAIDCEGMPSSVVQALARAASIPVFNGLAAADKPAQVLGDLLTLQEHGGKTLPELSLRYRGDAGSALGIAWTQAAAATGLKLEPESPEADFVYELQPSAQPALSAVDKARTTPPAAEQAANREFALQALLTAAVA